MADELTLASLERALSEIVPPPNHPRGTRDDPYYFVFHEDHMKSLGLHNGDLVEVPLGLCGGAGTEPRPLMSYFARVYTQQYIPLPSRGTP